MASLIVLLITLVFSVLALPFWLCEQGREKERHARQLEAIRAETARFQQDQAYRAWLAQQAAQQQQQAMQQGGQADPNQPPQGQQGWGPPPGPPPRWS